MISIMTIKQSTGVKQRAVFQEPEHDTILSNLRWMFDQPVNL
jgi:hypothetical protein